MADTPSFMSSISDAVNPQNLGVLASLYSGMNTSDAIKSAAGTLQGGLQTAEKTVADAAQPYAATGAAANQQLATGLQAGGEFNKPFTMADAANSEAMKTALTQGTNAIQNSAAAKGGLLGTNTLAGLSDYGQQTGAAYENQAFNQDQAQKQMALGGLQNLSGLGENAAMTSGTNVANLQASGAQAGMNATLGAAGAENAAVQNAIAAYKSLAPTATTTTGGTTAPKLPAVNISTGSAGAPTTGTASGVPAGAATGANGQVAPSPTPGQINTGTVQPGGMIDPAQAAQINAQNAAAQGGAVATPVTQGSTQTTTPASQAGAGPASPMSVDPATAAANAANTAAGIPSTTDLSAWTGANVTIDPVTSFPIDSATGTFVSPTSTFDNWFNTFLTSTDTGNMGAGVTDPLAEFLSTPAADLWGTGAGMNLNAINDVPIYSPPPVDAPMDMGTAYDTSYMYQ